MMSKLQTVLQYGQLVIAFNLPTQWRSREEKQRVSGRSSTLNSAL